VTYPACSGLVSRTLGREANRSRELAIPSVSPVYAAAKLDHCPDITAAPPIEFWVGVL
jgi:hypothetical protein